MRKPTVYIFMNKSLQMSPGKLAAQAAHAMAMVKTYPHWRAAHRTIMIMEARDQQHMENIEAYLKERYVDTVTIVDEGVNETDPHVKTALATQVVDKSREDVQDIFSTFKTYRELIRFSGEIER